jgi:hypothetical protein
MTNGVSLQPRASDAISLRRASNQLVRAERDVLTRESALKASTSGSSHTTYIYEIGPDGKRYVVGAEVSIIAPEDELNGVPGVRTLRTEEGHAKLSRQPDGRESEAPSSVTKNGSDEAVARLQRTEREVIAHESAHKAAAGRFGGPVHYTYTTGPDGRRYITGGEVPIHTPATSDPEEALRNARQVMRAALAPGDPSGQDIAVAASAASSASDARAKIASGEGEKNSAPETLGGKAERSYADFKSPRGLWSRWFGFENPSEENCPEEYARQSRFKTPILDIPA